MTESSPPSQTAAGPDRDLDLALTLCTRLCHDLAGPVGAVNTGAELLAEEEGGVDSETLELLSSSARSAADRLKLCRMAFGAARGRSPGLEDALATLAAGLETQGKGLETRLGSVADPGPEVTRILLNLAMVAAEAWPRSRRVLIDAAGGAFLVSTDADGVLGEVWRAALSDERPDLEPRTVQAALIARLARAAGALIDLPPGRGGTIRLAPPLIAAG